MCWRFCLSLLLACLVVSCSSTAPEDDPLAGLDAYKQAGGKVRGHDVLPVGADVNVSVSAAGVVSDDDIVWAPEDDSVPMPGGLEELWKKPENKSWHESYVEASKQSRHTGQPLLIWFTDTQHSPLCRKLSNELFSHGDFDGWASMSVVRLRVDSSIPSKERGRDIGVRKLKYIENLKKRYKVKGHPTVLILSPRGAVEARYRGFKPGYADYYWGRMKGDVNKAADDYGAWREKLEKKGYRMWTSRDGRKTFAKLYRFQPGKVTLIDPDGNRGSTSFRKLSDQDQSWVMLEKKKYEARKKH
ncbi:thioredoxin family protein [Verrucomicrobiaceae bacterium N1E253]|uniref:Thioredoxin family protein n=1 Tax=Oceaniferula marina TaxID=2748318 RepID=A0A851GPE1_9BACT|nr:thioredoxin family protein [Oceaniferula marina]NWK56014.1 thioredoxin family protein [Oceaniferula marina]